MSKSPESPDAIDVVMSLEIGDTFILNGRTFTKRTYSIDGYENRVVFGVWNAKGTATGATVYPDAKVEVAR